MPLPLPGEMKLVWQKIQKVIDPLHISNHKVRLYYLFFTVTFLFDPKILEARMQHFVSTIKSFHRLPWCKLDDMWRIVCLAWEVQKILNSMTKNHCHFFLHRMIIRRNKLVTKLPFFILIMNQISRYTEHCHVKGKYPVLPSVKVLKKQKVYYLNICICFNKLLE